MHIPDGEMATKDAIARELLSETSESDRDGDGLTSLRSLNGNPSFLNDDCETDVEILTGDAE